MLASVRYQFRDAIAVSTVKFEGSFITVAELRHEIAHKTGIQVDELVLSRVAAPGVYEAYRDGSDLVPNGSLVDVRRVPVAAYRHRALVGLTLPPPCTDPAANMQLALVPEAAAEAEEMQVDEVDEFGADPMEESMARLAAQDEIERQALQEAKAAAAAATAAHLAAQQAWARMRADRRGVRGRVCATVFCARCNTVGLHWQSECPMQDVPDLAQPAGPQQEVLAIEWHPAPQQELLAVEAPPPTIPGGHPAQHAAQASEQGGTGVVCLLPQSSAPTSLEAALKAKVGAERARLPSDLKCSIFSSAKDFTDNMELLMSYNLLPNAPKLSLVRAYAAAPLTSTEWQMLQQELQGGVSKADSQVTARREAKQHSGHRSSRDGGDREQRGRGRDRERDSHRRGRSRSRSQSPAPRPADSHKVKTSSATAVSARSKRTPSSDTRAASHATDKRAKRSQPVPQEPLDHAEPLMMLRLPRNVNNRTETKQQKLTNRTDGVTNHSNGAGRLVSRTLAAALGLASSGRRV